MRGMRRRPEDRLTPVEIVGSAWPDVPDDAPAELVAIAEVARRLVAVMDGRSQRAVARSAGMSHTTIGRLVEGRTWSNLRDLGRLEAALGVALWPGAATGGT